MPKRECLKIICYVAISNEAPNRGTLNDYPVWEYKYKRLVFGNGKYVNDSNTATAVFFYCKKDGG